MFSVKIDSMTCGVAPLTGNCRAPTIIAATWGPNCQKESDSGSSINSYLKSNRLTVKFSFNTKLSKKMSRKERTESIGDTLCSVCHERTEIYAIGQCDHPICYRCSTRMRVLCNQMYCPICRGDLPQVK